MLSPTEFLIDQEFVIILKGDAYTAYIEIGEASGFSMEKMQNIMFMLTAEREGISGHAVALLNNMNIFAKKIRTIPEAPNYPISKSLAKENFVLYNCSTEIISYDDAKNNRVRLTPDTALYVSNEIRQLKMYNVPTKPELITFSVMGRDGNIRHDTRALDIAAAKEFYGAIDYEVMLELHLLGDEDVHALGSIFERRANIGGEIHGTKRFPVFTIEKQQFGYVVEQGDKQNTFLRNNSGKPCKVISHRGETMYLDVSEVVCLIDGQIHSKLYR